MASTDNVVPQESTSQAELQQIREELFEQIDAVLLRLTYGNVITEFSQLLEECLDQATQLQRITKKLGKSAERQSNVYFEHIRQSRAIIIQLQEEAEHKKQQDRIIEAQIASYQSTKASSIEPILPSAICLDDFRLTPFDGQPCHYRTFEKLFEAIYERNCYTEAQIFLAFRNLVGEEGRKLISNLDPTAEGLKTAKSWMREHFDDEFRVRSSVRQHLENLPIVKYASQIDLLRLVLTTFEESVKTLQNCDTDRNVINISFVPLILPKLPRTIRSAYLHEKGQSWDALELIDFLRSRIRFELQLNESDGTQITRPANSRMNVNLLSSTHSSSTATASGSAIPVPSNLANPVPSNSAPGSAANAPSNSACRLCGGAHITVRCNSFDSSIRRAIAVAKRLCFRCLTPGHRVNDCRSTYTCRCGENHSAAICQQSLQATQVATTATAIAESNDTSLPSEDSNENIQVNLVQPREMITNDNYRDVDRYANHSHCHTYAPTFLVKINGIITRVLLDSGADRSIISESLAQQANLPTILNHSLPIGGFEGQQPRISTRAVGAHLSSLAGDYGLDVTLFTVTKMPTLRCSTLTSDDRQLLAQNGFDINDAHIGNAQQYPIHLIIGNEYCWEIGPLQPPTRLAHRLFVILTRFGWIFSGLKLKNEPLAIRTLSMCDDTPEPVPTSICLSEQRLANEYLEEFMQSKIIMRDCHYVVSLPWIYPIDLSNNCNIAWKRFQRLIVSLKSRSLFNDYCIAMKEILDNFAEPAPSAHSDGKLYYLPHHAVLRPEKLTSRIRIVFDGSSHDTGLKSLNDCLFKGTTSWNSYALFIKFRFGRTAVTADIKQAFLQIGVEECDRDALRFWWFDQDQQPKQFRFKVVPFGTSASPFLLFAAMQRHFSAFRSAFTDVVPLIQSNFYVDDLLIATSNPRFNLETLQERTIELFKFAGMTICKWRTNQPIDKKWAPEGDNIVKVLGHRWQVLHDTLSLDVDVTHFQSLRLITKRQFSSFASSIYDPIGFVLPFTIKVRLFLRKLWKLNTKWDEAIPEELLEEAHHLIIEASNINAVTLPRNVMTGDPEKARLIVFADASHSALGVAAYCVSGTESHLLASKGKLARDATTPALELDALVLARAFASQLNELYQFPQIIVVSDSLLNLQRLLKHPNDQRPSIALKINQLKKLGSAQYQHIRSQDNPADLISRGSDVTTLLKAEKWWYASSLSSDTCFDETIGTQIFAINTTDLNDSCNCPHFDSFQRALHYFEAIAKFVTRAGARLTRYRDKQTRDLALLFFIRSTQRDHFRTELADLSQGDQIDRASKLRNFNCFIDDNYLLRIRTRLQQFASLTYDQVNPIILPKNCIFSRLLAKFEHVRNAHAGVSRIIESIRERYFIVGLKQLVNTVANRCLVCRRIRAQTLTHIHGPVPPFRYDQSTAPFTNTGMDIFGPIKANLISKEKRYGLIFTCATTRAVHLELLKNITADSVFQSMRKFIARRGFPHLIYSDNGTQLVAIQRRLIEFVEQLSREHPDCEIRFKWLNLSVASPWRGGFYERLIRTVKHALTTMTFRKAITDDELDVILSVIEGHLNGRPLFTFEGQTISPSSFFAGKSLSQLPPIGNRETMAREGIIDEFLRSQRRVNAIWRNWRSQYLLQLRQFHQNNGVNSSPNLKVGDIVILKNNLNIDSWPLAIITGLGPQPDGIVRTVDLRTLDSKQENFRARATKTLIPLECDHENRV